jgi:heme exporter protein D
MAEFFHMGGYGAYVWSAYGAFALIVGGLTLSSLRASGRAKRELKDLEARQGHARRKAATETP